MAAHNYSLVFCYPDFGRGPVEHPPAWATGLSTCGFEMFQPQICMATTEPTGPGDAEYKTERQPSLLASCLGLQ